MSHFLKNYPFLKRAHLDFPRAYIYICWEREVYIISYKWVMKSPQPDQKPSPQKNLSHLVKFWGVNWAKKLSAPPCKLWLNLYHWISNSLLKKPLYYRMIFNIDNKMKQVQYLEYLNNEKLLFFFSCYFFHFPNFHQLPLLFDYLYWIKPNAKVFWLTFTFVLLIISLFIPICFYNKIYRKLFVILYFFSRISYWKIDKGQGHNSPRYDQ